MISSHWLKEIQIPQLQYHPFTYIRVHHSSSLRPPLLPQNAREGAEASAGVSDYQQAVDSFKRDMAALLGNRDYILLMLSFGIGVGFFNALLTLLNQIVQPFGYT